MRRSIKKLLVIWLSLVLGGLWSVWTIVGYSLAVKFSNDAYDRELVNSADSVAARMRVKDGRLVVDLPPAAQAILRYNNVDKFYYQVLKRNGELVSGDAALPRPTEAGESDLPRFRTARVGCEEVRIAEIKASFTEAHGEPMIVQVGETLKSRQQLCRDIWISIVVPQLMMVLLGASALWLGVRRGLKPLQVLQKAILRRSPADLRPVDEGMAPEEVLPLVQAVNDLLGRLREDMKAQQRFIANAAHQLRTPLAGLKTYSSLGISLCDIDEVQGVMKQIDSGLDRTTHLVNQLLSLARIDPVSTPCLQHDLVDLNFVTSDVVADLISLAAKKDIELGFESSRDPALLIGDIIGLQQLIGNLLDNALVYTPNEGKVSIAVATSAQAVQLSVTDSGPGIPASERDRIFERFYRIAGSPGAGSGLGLAIVREVARAHNAEVTVDGARNGAGTQITVRFPRAESQRLKCRDGLGGIPKQVSHLQSVSRTG